jgi:putative nucleotidyltransferase with HDIG domain
MLILNPDDFIQIPTMLVSYDCGIKFDVYIRKGDNFFLFARHGQLNEGHKQRLRAHDVEELYVHSEDISSYDEYIEMNFSSILQDDSIPVHDRSKMVYDYSLGLGRNLLHSGEKGLPTPKHRLQLESLAESTYEFMLRKRGASKSIVTLISHNYRTFSHCVNVSVYAMLIMVALEYGRHRAKLIGAGAVLHDIGKAWVPREILDKPGRLTPEERLVINEHPVHGFEICRDMDLDPLSVDCVIHHHEKLDGSGYPAQTPRVPEHVRIVSIADIFDALTSDRPYAKAYTPMEAFKILVKDVEAGRLDKDICREFMLIMSDGQLTTE